MVGGKGKLYQLNVVGKRFFEFILAGSRVAFAHASVSATGRKAESFMVKERLE